MANLYSNIYDINEYNVVMKSIRNKLFSITAKVWRWPGDMGWHFISLDTKISENIRKSFPKGFVKIKARLGKSEWNTSLFPHRETKIYLLAIKKSIRRKEGVIEGESVTIDIFLKV